MNGVDTRERLPETRQSITHKFNVCGHEGYVTVGMYDDGRPGEMFIRMAKCGSTVRGLVDSVAIMASIALQHGAPVDRICDKMIGMRFEPLDDHATSIIDSVFKWMHETFVVPNEEEKPDA